MRGPIQKLQEKIQREFLNEQIALERVGDNHKPVMCWTSKEEAHKRWKRRHPREAIRQQACIDFLADPMPRLPIKDPTAEPSNIMAAEMAEAMLREYDHGMYRLAYAGYFYH